MSNYNKLSYLSYSYFANCKYKLEVSAFYSIVSINIQNTSQYNAERLKSYSWINTSKTEH